MSIYRILVAQIFFFLIFAQPSNAEYQVKFDTEVQFVQNLSKALVDTSNKKELLKDVRKNGFIKVSVFYALEYSPEGDLDGIQVAKQREAIQVFHRQFIYDIQNQRFHVRIINRGIGSPRINMLVDEEAIKYLFNSVKVSKIEPIRGAKIF